MARYAVLSQAKNRSPVHLLARVRMRRHEMFRLAQHHIGEGDFRMG